MNVIKVYGGLGNQMFQYAFGKAMSQKGIQVAYDLSWFAKPSDPPRPYGLNKFNTRVIQRTATSNCIKETEATYYHYMPEYLKEEGKSFFGYWQNIQYVLPVLEDLKLEFKVNPLYRTFDFDRLKAQILTTDKAIGLHIRRGDYLTKGHHLLPLSYYKEALSAEALDGQLFIFSDDISWCKQQFGETAVYIDMEDYLSLELLKLCPYKIIANSTFSWWAAMLGNNKVVYAPVQWRLDFKEEDIVIKEGFIPTIWKRL